MKHIIFVVGLCLAISPNINAAPEVKRVCVDKKDKNGKVIKKADGTTVQECKNIKVHKKLEGTEVPKK